MILISACSFSNKKESSYSVTIKSYTKNGSHIEFPQIEGLGDKEKQNKINALLEKQVFLGAKNYLGEPFVDFSNPNYVYEFKSGSGLTNAEIASFWYSFNAYGEVYLDNGEVMRDTSRFFCITVDMKTGEVINLPDFMIVDERLINSTDGDDTKPDYDSAIQPTFHSLKDVFMIYSANHEKDNFHIFTPQETIDRLMNLKNETNWYITKNKDISFCFNQNSVEIPYSKIIELIHSEYINSLEK